MMMYSVAVPHGVTVHKGNKTSESKIEYEELVSFGSFLKSMRLADEKEEEEYGSRSYTPLSLFYTKGKSRKNYLPLSFFTTIIPMDMDNSPVLFRSYKEALLSDGSKSSRSESKTFLINKYPGSESKMFLMCKGNKSESKMGPMDKGNKSSQSKVSRNYIPLKLALSILSKLPIKSLKRFGCVRKSWSILFENSDFMTMYTNRFISHHVSDGDYHTFILSNHNASAYHLTSDYYLYNSKFHLLNNTVKFNLPPPFQQSGCHRRILNSASVNGIFCLHQEYPINLQYVLWNPATQEFLVIPRSPADLLQHPQNNLHLSHAFNGFGYDQLRDDFKVIQYITFDCECESYRPPIIESYFEIYSLKSNSWRTIDMNKDPSSIWCRCRLFDTREVYLDGACHWVISDGKYLAEKSLLSFDLSDEVFLTTPIGVQPPLPYSYEERLAVLNGSIALISNYHDDIIFHIYILGELGVGESWIKLYIYGLFSSITWPPVGFGKSGYIFFPKNDYELAYVDLSTQRIEEVGITGVESSYFQAGLYKESLLSIGGSSK